MPTRPTLQAADFVNERGIIATTYHELQAVQILDRARQEYPLPEASNASTLRAVFQSADIALLNLADLISRAASDIENGLMNSAVVKMSWARGFQSVLVCLSTLPGQLSLVLPNGENEEGHLSITDSPAYKKYFTALQSYDEAMLRTISDGTLPIRSLLSEQSLDSIPYGLIHLTRICNHETTVWEHNLACVCVPAAIPSYREFVVSQTMEDAVYDRSLQGDTYFTQFRGLHQIPELLSAEMNDRIAAAIRAIRAGKLPEAYEHLRVTNILSAAVVASIPAIVDNLSTSDYHTIRENLGLTSGSHSVSLHYHLFRDLYGQLAQELESSLLVSGAGDGIRGAVSHFDGQRFTDERSFLVHILVNESLSLRSFTQLWRDLHVHLPRNNLGGGYTKSLTGSADAVLAVKKMRDVARERDPMRALTLARSLGDANGYHENLSLSGYFEAETSLDRVILDLTGAVTKDNFQEVQERLGVFANRAPFTPPVKREV